MMVVVAPINRLSLETVTPHPSANFKYRHEQPRSQPAWGPRRWLRCPRPRCSWSSGSLEMMGAKSFVATMVIQRAWADSRVHHARRIKQLPI